MLVAGYGHQTQIQAWECGWFRRALAARIQTPLVILGLRHHDARSSFPPAPRRVTSPPPRPSSFSTTWRIPTSSVVNYLLHNMAQLSHPRSSHSPVYCTIPSWLFSWASQPTFFIHTTFNSGTGSIASELLLSVFLMVLL
jgi:hypothetical protein